MAEVIAQIRHFNRTVTQTIGALQDRYLGRARPLAECRLIFEIGESGAEVGELRSRLGLDSGYMSRLLRSLEHQKLISTRLGPRDKRSRYVQLTRSGIVELAELNQRSDRLAASILEPLNSAQRQRLVTAMAEVDLLLTAAAVQVDEVSPQSRDAQHCLEQYFSELSRRFEDGFDPAHSLAPTIEDFAPPLGSFLLMRLQGKPIGCGGFKSDESGAAYVKRMWISESARGLGLGRRLLQEIEEKARARGYRSIRLETEKSLAEAQQLYRTSGYREVEPFNAERYAHHWFEKLL